jgi:putative transposase
VVCAFTPSRGAAKSSASTTNAFLQNPEWPLEKLICSWKGFTARRINALLGRSGSLWQRDYFDRLVRDEKHLANCMRYVRRNPEKAE